jgi:hypothetical protein
MIKDYDWYAMYHDSQDYDTMYNYKFTTFAPAKYEHLILS